MIFFLFLIGVQEIKAPDFSLKDWDGVYYNLNEELQKGPVILDFWATWCKPCLKSMPILDSLYKKYKKSHLQVFGICVDTKRSISKAKSIWYSKKLSYTPLWDWNGDVMKKYEVKSIPTFIIIDSDGKIVFRRKGYKKKEARVIEDTLRAVLLKYILEKARKKKRR